MSEEHLSSAPTNEPEVDSLNSVANDPILLHASLASLHLGPSVTVVVCTRYRPSSLRICLNAIGRLDPAPDDVLVVDNSQGDVETRQVAREFGARYLLEPGSGLSRARNRGMAESCTEIVAFMDDDAEPCEDWLEKILAPFDDPGIASVSGEIIPPNDPRAGATIPPTRYLSNQDPQWFEIATFGGLGRGSNLALRKSACSAWKGFDVRLGRGAPLRIAEESHAYASLLSLGFRAAHVPAALVVHPAKVRNIQQEATSSMAYWLLLFFEFPSHRADLVRFLARRLRGKPLTWPRNPQVPGAIITSGWGLRLKAAVAGMMVYLKSLKLRGK